MTSGVLSQRDAELGVLTSVYTRSEDKDSASRIQRVRNRLTADGFLTSTQFDDAVETLLKLQMVAIDRVNREELLRISDHGRGWLLTNFHWVQGDVATLAPNSENWVMTAPGQPSDGAKLNYHA